LIVDDVVEAFWGFERPSCGNEQVAPTGDTGLDGSMCVKCRIRFFLTEMDEVVIVDVENAGK
jgi:hypothetical protein